MCLQETNISEEVLPGAALTARKSGWSMISLPKPRLRKGGAAVLLRESPSGFLVKSEQEEWGQLLAVEVLGADRPLVVTCCYRHKLPGLAAAAAMVSMLRSLRDKTWVVAADWNEAVGTDGQWATIMSEVGGAVAAAGRYDRGSKCIDGVWVSLAIEMAGHQPTTGAAADHESLLVWIPMSVPRAPREWSFARHARVADGGGPEAEEAEAPGDRGATDPDGKKATQWRRSGRLGPDARRPLFRRPAPWKGLPRPQGATRHGSA